MRRQGGPWSRRSGPCLALTSCSTRSRSSASRTGKALLPRRPALPWSDRQGRIAGAKTSDWQPGPHREGLGKSRGGRLQGGRIRHRWQGPARLRASSCDPQGAGARSRSAGIAVRHRYGRRHRQGLREAPWRPRGPLDGVSGPWTASTEGGPCRRRALPALEAPAGSLRALLLRKPSLTDPGGPGPGLLAFVSGPRAGAGLPAQSSGKSRG